MEFLATPLNFSIGLLCAFGVIVIFFLTRKKPDSNLPLIFYIAVMGFVLLIEVPLNPYLVYGGLMIALILRFEFLNEFLLKLFTYVAMLAIALLIVDCVSVMTNGNSMFPT